MVFLNGQLLFSGASNDYVISGATLTFQAARNAPLLTDVLQVFATSASIVYVSVPATSTSTGVQGQRAVDTVNALIYECIATNSWARYAIGSSTFGQPQTLTYASNGDTNGAIYVIGTQAANGTYGAQVFANPAPTKVQALNSLGSAITIFTDRAANDDYFFNDGTAPWMALDLGAGRFITLNKYTLLARASADRAIWNWKLQGSNSLSAWTTGGVAGATWVDLDVRVNDTTMPVGGTRYGAYTPSANPSTGYRYLRLLYTGVNRYSTGAGDSLFCIAEIEIYGTLAG